MSSAALPAFLLARRVTGRRWPGVPARLRRPSARRGPSIRRSSLTEVVAYPAFLWAALAMHKAIATPTGAPTCSRLAIALAFFARTQFVVLVGVLPVALLAYELECAQAGRLTSRALAVRSPPRYADTSSSRGAYGALLVASARLHPQRAAAHPAEPLQQGNPAALLTSCDRRRDDGTCRQISPSLWGSSRSSSAPPGSSPARYGPRQTPALPCVRLYRRDAFVVLLWLVSAWDLTIGTFVLDRYLFYLTPILVLGFVCALRDPRRPRWSLAPPAAFSPRFCDPPATGFLWSGAYPLEPGLSRRAADLAGSCVARRRSGAPRRDLDRCDPWDRRALRGPRPLGPGHDPPPPSLAIVLLRRAFRRAGLHVRAALLTHLGHSGRPLTAI